MNDAEPRDRSRREDHAHAQGHGGPARAREPEHPIPRWARAGDVAAEAILWGVLALGAFSHGLSGDARLRAVAWVGCALLGCWSAVAWAGGRMTAPGGIRRTPALLAMLALKIVVIWQGLSLVPIPAGIARALSPVQAEIARAAEAAGLELPARVALAHAPARGLEEWNRLVAYLLFLSGASVLATRRRASIRMATGLGWIAVIEGLWGLGAFALGEPRARGAIYNPNHHAALVAAGLPIFFAMLRQRRVVSPEAADRPLIGGGDPTILVLGLGCVGAVGWLASLSRGSLLLGGATLAAWLAVEALGARRERLGDADDEGEDGGRSGPRALGAATALVASLAVVAVAGSLFDGFARRARGVETDVPGRTELWRGAIRALGETPWLGLGPGGARAALERHAAFPMDRLPVHVHMDVLEIVCETGVPASAAALCALAAAGIACARDARRRAGELPWSLRLPARAAAVGAAMGLAHSLVDFPLRVPTVGLVHLALLALALNPDALLRGTLSAGRPARFADREGGRRARRRPA